MIGLRKRICVSTPTDRFGYPATENEVTARAHETGPLRIVFLGNVIPRKCLHVLVTASHLQPKQSNFHLDVIGRIDINRSYASAVFHSAYDLPDPLDMEIHGPLDTENLIAKLTSAQVLVVPSSYEGFGIVYMEAMFCGLPIVCSNEGGQTDFLKHRQNANQIN